MRTLDVRAAFLAFALLPACTGPKGESAATTPEPAARTHVEPPPDPEPALRDSFTVVSAVRPAGSYGRARSAYRRTVASAPPLSVPAHLAPAVVPTAPEPPVLAEGLAVVDTVTSQEPAEVPELSVRTPDGPVRVEIDDEVAVEVGLGDDQVVVTVEATERATGSLDGLEAELQQELARDGQSLDYEQRSRQQARDEPGRRPHAVGSRAESTREADDPSEASEPVVARGKVINQVA